MKDTLVGVTSRSFSRNERLRQELLAKYPNVRFNDDGVSLSGRSLIQFAQGCRKLITALEKIDSSFLNAATELEVISKYGVGTDMLDKEAMIQRGIRLGWTGGVNRRSVSELVVAFAIAALRHVPETNREVRNGVWRNRMGKQLSGKTVGIIGCGNIGKDLAQILRAFSCRVLSYDIRSYPEFYSANGVSPVDLDTLLEKSDIVTLHVPLDDSTRNLLDADRLQKTKPGMILINAARGGLVDEMEMKRMLRTDRISAACFDVFSTEPPEDRELLALPNFLATPHIGGSSEEAVLAMGRAAINGLDVNQIPSADYPPAG